MNKILRISLLLSTIAISLANSSTYCMEHGIGWNVPEKAAEILIEGNDTPLLPRELKRAMQELEHNIMPKVTSNTDGLFDLLHHRQEVSLICPIFVSDSNDWDLEKAFARIYATKLAKNLGAKSREYTFDGPLRTNMIGVYLDFFLQIPKKQLIIAIINEVTQYLLNKRLFKNHIDVKKYINQVSIIKNLDPSILDLDIKAIKVFLEKAHIIIIHENSRGDTFSKKLIFDFLNVIMNFQNTPIIAPYSLPTKKAPVPIDYTRIPYKKIQIDESEINHIIPNSSDLSDTFGTISEIYNSSLNYNLNENEYLYNLFANTKAIKAKKLYRALLNSCIILNDLKNIQTEDGKYIPPEIAALIINFTDVKDLASNAIDHKTKARPMLKGILILPLKFLYSAWIFGLKKYAASQGYIQNDLPPEEERIAFEDL